MIKDAKDGEDKIHKRRSARMPTSPLTAGMEPPPRLAKAAEPTQGQGQAPGGKVRDQRVGLPSQFFFSFIFFSTFRATPIAMLGCPSCLTK